MAEHDRTYLLRCSQEWRDLVDEAAARADLDTAEWIRRVTRDAAEDALKEAERGA